MGDVHKATTAHDKPLKSLILSAGLGSRLAPLTNTIPKPLATVLNVPLLNAAVRRCLLAGSKDLAFNTHHLARVLTDYIEKNAPNLGAERIYVSHETPNILGTGGALRAISSWWGKSPLLVYNGDILSDLPLDDLATMHMNSGNFVTMAVRRSPPEDGGRSVWVDTSGYVKIIAKKADLPKNSGHLRELGFACAYVTEPAIQGFLPEGLIYYDVILAFNSALAAGHKIKAIQYDGFWADIGTPRSLWETNIEVGAMPETRQLQLLGQLPRDRYINRDASVIIDDTSIVSASAIIGAAARIENSVLLDGAVVRPSELVRHSIRGSGLDLSF